MSQATEQRMDSTATGNGLQLDALALAGAAAVIASLCMLLLGILGAMGLYQGGVEMMQQWHLYFAPTIGGTIAGMIEAAVITFVGIYVVAWLYNVITTRRGTAR